MDDKVDGRGRSIPALGLAIDLRAEPWRYPGPFLPFSCLQVGDQLLSVAEDPLDQLRQHTGTDLSDLHFVIAIGSNASPDVVRRKFERQNASTTLLHLLGQLDGVALGHSAHVSPPGYVPATPYPQAEDATDIVVSVLTAHQLQCLDETEPNYNRVTVSNDRVHLNVPARLPELVYIYESKWGILVDSAGTPLPFGAQDTAFERLAAWGALPPPIARAGDTRYLTHTLGERDDLRHQITDSLTRHAKRFGQGQRSATAP